MLMSNQLHAPASLFTGKEPLVPVKSPRYLLDKGSCGHQSQSGSCGQEKMSSPFQESNPGGLHYPGPGTTLMSKNYAYNGIKNRLNSGNAFYHSVQNGVPSAV
jgi:hypothetical protein